jgi:hypothetical protein
VKKVSRILLIALGAVLGVAVLILIGANMYVQSKAMQARIQEELGERLDAPIQVKRVSVTPWAGLKLSGITIPQSQPGVPSDFLTAKTFRLRIRFSSLFAQRLVIKDVSLINPDVVWAQNAEGKWRLPTRPAPRAKEIAATAAGPEQVVEPASPPGVEKAPEMPAVPLTVQPPVAQVETTNVPFTPEIERVKLVRGRFRFLDQNFKGVATFDQVDFRSDFRTATDLRGNIRIGKTSLRERFFLQQLQSPLLYDPTQLDFSQITARAGGGEITGRFTMQPQAQDSPFTVSVNFRDVQADRIISEAGGVLGTVTGKLEGYLNGNGNIADPNALSGEGEIVLRDGQVRQYSLLVALGQLLQIQELQQLQLDQAHVKYHINPGVVTIDELVFRSQSIRLSATGTVSFDGKLQLESELAVNEKMRSQLFRALRENFQPMSEPGYTAVSFQVSGTVGRPKTNLMDKLIGRDLKDLSSVISGLIGGGKSDRKKKKAAEEAAAVTPTPADAVSPTAVAAPAASVSPSPSASP